MLPRAPVVGLAQSFARRGARGWGWYYKALEEQSAAKVTPLAETLLNEPVAAAQRPRVFLSVRYDEGKTARLEFELAVRCFAGAGARRGGAAARPRPHDIRASR